MAVNIKTDFYQAERKARSSKDTFELITWNIGYAGLGKESDFKADGGQMIRPPSTAVAHKNLTGIVNWLQVQNVDAIVLQEVAKAGFLTRKIDVLSSVRHALCRYGCFFSTNIWSRFFPKPLSFTHGMASFTNNTTTRPTIIELVNEKDPLKGLIFQRYHVQITEIASIKLVIMNVHLSAFDKQASIRKEQLAQIISIAEKFYENGKSIIIAGDWNMRLSQREFPHTSTDEALFWVYDFPKAKIPKNWKLAFDDSVPTVRTNERPYKPRENYTTVIDGFITSPNIEIVSVKSVDLNFEFSDHQPVKCKFKIMKA